MLFKSLSKKTGCINVVIVSAGYNGKKWSI